MLSHSAVEQIGTVLPLESVLLGKGTERGYVNATVSPRSTAEIAALLAVAGAHAFPVHPRGTRGASDRDGLVVCLDGMAGVLETDAENLTAELQPGLNLASFVAGVAREGLFLPVDPDDSALTVGGAVATDAAGPRRLKYGTMRDYVLGLEVALANGEVIHTGAKTVKSASGYDLTRLLVGSGGTLGIITRATIRLLPLPERRCTIVAGFPSVVDAVRAAAAVMGTAAQPAALEILDTFATSTFRAAGLPVTPDCGGLLLCEVDGSEPGVDRQAGLVLQALADAGAIEPARVVAHDGDVWWSARRRLVLDCRNSQLSGLVRSVVVPGDRLVRLVTSIVELSKKHRLDVGLIAHAGNGIVLPYLPQPDGSSTARETYTAFASDLLDTVYALGGTASVGHGSPEYIRTLTRRHGALGLEMMTKLKKAFDPKNILNPLESGIGSGDAT